MTHLAPTCLRRPRRRPESGSRALRPPDPARSSPGAGSPPCPPNRRRRPLPRAPPPLNRARSWDGRPRTPSVGRIPSVGAAGAGARTASQTSLQTARYHSPPPGATQPTTQPTRGPTTHYTTHEGLHKPPGAPQPTTQPTTTHQGLHNPRGATQLFKNDV